jgi:hypoxanthine phosphoribosyltransferase
MELHLSTTPMINANDLQQRIATLAEEVNKHYGDEKILLLVVLKGSVPFSVDLMRQLKAPLEVDYIRAKSYDGTESTGKVHFTHLPEDALRDRHVLIVEDILDTGNTAVAILDFVRGQHPASAKFITLLDKPSRRTQAVEADFVGFTIEDHFVVGYGLDYNERYRELDAVYTMET